MSTIDEQLAQTKEKIKRLERQKQLKKSREKRREDAINARRNLIIGKMVTEYFTELLCFQPRRTAKENKLEFELLADILSFLAADKKYLGQLKTKAAAKYLSED